MAILNYTTKIDATKTAGEIQLLLAKHGAKNVSIDFENGLPVALAFLIEFNKEPLGFRLPSNHKGVYQAMREDRDVPKSLKTEEQARRVAWRILKDWVESQMAMIQSRKATMVELFMSYYITPSGQTLYETFEEKGFKMLPQAK